MALQPSGNQLSSYRGSSYRSLGDLLRYFVGYELSVELKNGRIYRGVLSSSTQSMDLTLSDATITYQNHQQSSNNEHPHHALLSVRGSQIRYIQFPDDANLPLIIKQGAERESKARNQYQRQLRK